MTVDWEHQAAEMILVTWQTDDDRGQIAWVVGRPQDDNADDERRAIEKAVAAALAVTGDSEIQLYRLIFTEQPSDVRGIWGSPERPTTVDALVGVGDETFEAVIAAAHRLVEAKLDPHEDTAA